MHIFYIILSILKFQLLFELVDLCIFKFQINVSLGVSAFWDWESFGLVVATVIVVSTTGVRQIAARKAVSAAPFSGGNLMPGG